MKLARGAAALALVAALGLSLQAPPKPAAAAAAAAPTISELARDLERVESLREIKDVQRTYAHLAQFGRWADMAALFADDGALQWGTSGLDAGPPVVGRAAIKTWLETDAGAMDGIKPGSLHTVIIDEPLINLSVDGRSAKGRWNGLRFLGDGQGQARIEGGIYENQYVLDGDQWRISLLRYYPLYAGTYADGWRNVGGSLPIVPYHFTPDEAGIPIPPAEGAAPATTATVAQVANRIDRLNNEDEVRNLQHAYGYYVDERMWTDVVDLFTADATLGIDNVGVYHGPAGVRRAMERMGPENLAQGILNNRIQFDTIVDVNPNGREATARGIELAMVGDANTRAASWEFTVFRNRFVKENGLWKIKDMNLTPLVIADYATGWGNGGTAPAATGVPAFLDVDGRSSQPVPGIASTTDPTDLKRRLGRSSAFDGAENVSMAYSAYLDDLRILEMSQIHAAAGHKLSPFAGWFQGPARILQAGVTVYGTNPPTVRGSLSMHWRPQPVVSVSQDGRSATLRARLLQPRTSNTSAGTFNGAMYNDEFVLENGIWRIWSLTIDEFYWQSVNWAGGWAAANPRDPSLPDPGPSSLVTLYPPDVLLSAVGERSRGFQGGSPRYIAWPGIVPMWFHYRNPVSGRLPTYYWPDCAPCAVRPDWKLTAHGYQKPPTGPSLVTATSAPTGWGTAATVTVTVSAGPDEPLTGPIRLGEGTTTLGTGTLTNGKATITLPAGLPGGTHTVTVSYPGSDSLAPGQTTVTVTVNLPASWKASTTYDTGDQVTHNGKVYVAGWYSKNQAPGDPYGAWQELAMTLDGTTVWTPSRVFDTGDRVTHDGQLYEAKWWTRNQQPGDQYGPWKPIS
ncbi:nuclear transport factor 2 family protein [Rhizomonospora bruguierae]|uniref:nuclear transport factor 2 family protein n=1 Tax=Rhizomonospora bruguierae TaxID=1581705 RepID=UPI001BCFAB8B|nr:nuclear transport factor 2 family protein [Micromonospora sp. NBRC 107566]